MAKNAFLNHIFSNLKSLFSFDGGEGFWSTLRSISNYGSSWLNKQTGADLTGSEKAMMQYQTSERESAQAFEERMSSTAFQRQVADMQAAGLNPALMYGSGSNGASTPSSSGQSAPGFSSASSMSELIQLMTLKPTIENLKAQNEDIKATAELKKQQKKTEEFETSIRKAAAEFAPDKYREEVSELMSRALKESNESAAASAQAALTWAKTEYQNKENERYDELFELRRAIMKAQEGQMLSDAEEAKMRAWVEREEATYMHDTGFKMSDNEYIGLAFLIGKMFNVSPSKMSSWLSGLMKRD